MGSANFWVIGSEFTDTAFETVIDGTQAMFGPFVSYDDARSAWREKADATRANCHMRYPLVEEAGQA